MAIEPGSQFYHGTLSELNEGDIISPRSKTGAESNFFEPTEKERENDKRLGIPEYNSSEHAYATSHPEAADNYALEAAEKRRTKESGRPARYVYEVEPLDASDVERDHYGPTSYRSASGFRVVKRHP
jgi:hypothetical protein